MTDWYKMNPVDWNEGTQDLTLEQEAAYLRICNAIYIAEGPIRDNIFVVAGLLRCSDRKARRLLDELVAAGKLNVENNHIVNRRAVDEVSTRSRRRVERKASGSRGGSESAKSRANLLINNDCTPEVALSKSGPDEKREDEKREYEKREDEISPPPPSPQKRFADPSIVLQSVLNPMSARQWVMHCEEKGRKPSSQQAEEMVGVLRNVRALGVNPDDAVKLAIRRGWVSIEIEFLRNAGLLPGGEQPPGRAPPFPKPNVATVFGQINNELRHEREIRSRAGDGGLQSPILDLPAIRHG
jgi:uncharacterized protein YdaU (DUF1376 family)